MMSEEVNISAWWMPSKIFDLYEKWIENRDNDLSRMFLVDMYLYLTSQKMIRLISDLHSVYLFPPDYVKAKYMKDLMQIHKNIQKRYPTVYSSQSQVGKVALKVDMGKYPVKLQPCIRGIIYNLEKCSYHVFFWIKKLCDIEKEAKAPKYKYMNIVWNILNRFIDQTSEYGFVKDTISALQKFFTRMGHREKPIYLYHAVLLMVRRNEIDWNSTPPQLDTSIANVTKLYGDHLRGCKMDMDDYVLDLHTKRMKWSDHCLRNFALEGAYVKNENRNFLNQEYREIYILLKKELDIYFSRGGKLK
jgi:hypothetical protein